MKPKVLTTTKKIGFIKNTQPGEFPTKTYISLAIQGNKRIIVLQQYLLSDVEYFGWETVKTLNGQHLQFDELTIRFDTFMGIADAIKDKQYIFDAIKEHLKSHDDAKMGDN